MATARKSLANHPGPLESFANPRSAERRGQVVLEHVQYDPVRASELRIPRTLNSSLQKPSTDVDTEKLAGHAVDSRFSIP